MPVYEEKEEVNGQKRYYIRLYIESPNGKSKQITRHNKKWIGRNGKVLAQQEEVRLRNKNFNDYEDMTVDEIANEYLKNLKLNWKESTYLKNFDNYNLYIKPYFGFKKANNISARDILDWKNIINEKKFALNYKKGFYSTFSAIINFGCKYYNLSKNVVRIEGNFKNVKGSKKKEMKIITDYEFKESIKNEQDIFYYVAYNILFYVGLRRGELLALNINDLDIKNNTIRIDETVNPKISLTPYPPKTDKANRILPIKKELMDLILQLIDKRTFENGYIFLKNITLSTLKRKSDRNLRSIGFSENQLIRIHDYRHSFATMCINFGVAIQVLSEYMGHENISITWDTYGHLYPDAKNTLVDKIGNIITIESVDKLIKQDQKQD